MNIIQHSSGFTVIKSHNLVWSLTLNETTSKSTLKNWFVSPSFSAMKMTVNNTFSHARPFNWYGLRDPPVTSVGWSDEFSTSLLPWTTYKQYNE